MEQSQADAALRAVDSDLTAARLPIQLSRGSSANSIPTRPSNTHYSVSQGMDLGF